MRSCIISIQAEFYSCIHIHHTHQLYTLPAINYVIFPYVVTHSLTGYEPSALNATIATKEEYWDSKYGRIAILKEDNYSNFKMTCIIALASEKCLGIVIRIKQLKENAIKAEIDDFKKKIALAIKIIINSVSLLI